MIPASERRDWWTGRRPRSPGQSTLCELRPAGVGAVDGCVDRSGQTGRVWTAVAVTGGRARRATCHRVCVDARVSGVGQAGRYRERLIRWATDRHLGRNIRLVSVARAVGGPIRAQRHNRTPMGHCVVSCVHHDRPPGINVSSLLSKRELIALPLGTRAGTPTCGEMLILFVCMRQMST